MTEQFHFEWAFQDTDDDDIDTVRSLIEEGGGEAFVREQQGVLPIVPLVIAAVIAVVGLADVIIRVARATSCGILVDARSSPVEIRKDSALPRGTVTVVSSSGEEVRVSDVSKTQLADLIKASVGA